MDYLHQPLPRAKLTEQEPAEGQVSPWSTMVIHRKFLMRQFARAPFRSTSTLARTCGTEQGDRLKQARAPTYCVLFAVRCLPASHPASQPGALRSTIACFTPAWKFRGFGACGAAFEERFDDVGLGGLVLRNVREFGARGADFSNVSMSWRDLSFKIVTLKSHVLR